MVADTMDKIVAAIPIFAIIFGVIILLLAYFLPPLRKTSIGSEVALMQLKIVGWIALLFGIVILLWP